MAVEIAIGNPPQKNAAKWPQRPTFEAHLNPGIGLTSFRCGFVIEVISVGFGAVGLLFGHLPDFAGIIPPQSRNLRLARDLRLTPIPYPEGR